MTLTSFRDIFNVRLKETEIISREFIDMKSETLSEKKRDSGTWFHIKV